VYQYPRAFENGLKPIRGRYRALIGMAGAPWESSAWDRDLRGIMGDSDDAFGAGPFFRRVARRAVLLPRARATGTRN